MPSRIILPAPLSSNSFTTRDAHAAGLGRGRLRGPDIDHPFHGVNTPTTVDLDVVGLARALASRAPSTAFFCGPTAALLFGVPLPRRLERSTELHVAVPAPGTAPVGRGVIGHSFRIMERELSTHHGIRVSSPARTWCELSTYLTLDELIVAGDYLLFFKRPLCTRSDIADMVRHFPARKHKAKRAEAAASLHDRCESAKETEVRLLFTRAGMPGLMLNHEIRTSDGHVFWADLAFPANKVVIEYQSGFHDSSQRKRADQTRRRLLEAEGWTVIEINSGDLLNPAALVASIRSVLAR